MKKKSAKSSASPDTPAPAEDDIRNYAYHFFELRGGEPGHDVEDWLEARAWLLSSVLRHHTPARLPMHLPRPYPDLAAEEANEARHMNT